MKKLTRFFGLGITLFLVLALAGTVQAKPVSFKLASFLPLDEPVSQVGQWIEKDLNENAKDLVDCKYYHSAQMGSTIEIVKKVRMGTLQAGWMTGNYAPDLHPKFGIGTLAYCMESYEKWNALIENEELREELFTCLSSKGLRVVDVGYFGIYGLATTKPVRSLDELRQMKMRTTQAQYPVAFWNALGVNPVPLAWGDTFPALKQGVVDGTDQTMSVANLRLTDVCKYFTRTNHMLGLHYLVVNDKWYNNLDPKVRDVIMASIAKNFAKVREIHMKMTEEMPSTLKSKGIEVIVLPDEEMAKFKEAEMGVWKQFESEIGKEWLDKVSKFTSEL